jgi:putative glutathione S-transferase
MPTLQPHSARDGAYRRPPAAFRNWITADGSPGPGGQGGFPAESGRYHLYVGLFCPWASRTLIARGLKGLEDHVSISIVEPRASLEGWRFGSTGDRLYGSERLADLYRLAQPDYGGRATVPVLWDKKRRTIVSNESGDILRMFDQAFASVAGDAPALRPNRLAAQIDALNAWLDTGLNDGVYRAGFATAQAAYEEAVRQVFATLDALEERLADTRPYLFGGTLTESDVRLFVTLVRFDLVYHGLFKCNLKRLADYPGLEAYLHRLLAIPAFVRWVDPDNIRRGYYSMEALNPSGIVPLGPPDPPEIARRVDAAPAEARTAPVGEAEPVEEPA